MTNLTSNHHELENLKKRNGELYENTDEQVNRAVVSLTKKPKFVILRKIILSIISVIVILLGWSYILTAMLIFALSRRGIIENDDFGNLINMLNFSNSSISVENIFNNTGIEVICPNGYFFNGTRCNWICGVWHPAGLEALPILRYFTSTLATIGIILCIMTLLTFIVKPFFKDPTPAKPTRKRCLALFDSITKISSFWVILFSSVMTILFAIVDYQNPTNLYCTDLDTAILYQDITFPTLEPYYFINIYAAIFHFSMLSYFLWINVTLINIILTISFPLKISRNKTTKLTIVIIESCICFGIPLLAVVITLSIDRYTILFIYKIIDIRSSLLGTILYILPQFFAIAIITTLVTLVILKMRWMHLSNFEITNRETKIDPLEYRITAYSVVCVLLLTIITSCFIAFYVLRDQYHFLINDDLNCKTLASPISFNTKQHNNTTFEEYILAQPNGQSILELMYTCNHPGEYNELLTGFVFIIIEVCIRLVWSSVFIYILPTKQNYLCWKNILICLCKGAKNSKLFSFSSRFTVSSSRNSSSK